VIRGLQTSPTESLGFINFFLSSDGINGSFWTKPLVAERVLFGFVATDHHLGLWLNMLNCLSLNWLVDLWARLELSLACLNGLSSWSCGLDLTRMDHWLGTRAIVDDVVIDIVVGDDVCNVPGNLLLIVSLLIYYFVVVTNILNLEVVRLTILLSISRLRNLALSVAIVKINSTFFNGRILHFLIPHIFLNLNTVLCWLIRFL
jgi:hypothetical protein